MAVCFIPPYNNFNFMSENINKIYLELESSGEVYLKNKLLYLYKNKYLINLLGIFIGISSFLLLIYFFIKYNEFYYIFFILTVIMSFTPIIILFIIKFFESLTFSYPAKINIGCKINGGIGNMNMGLYKSPGPLQNRINLYIKKKKLSKKEEETFNTLKDEWSGSVDQLFEIIDKI